MKNRFLKKSLCEIFSYLMFDISILSSSSNGQIRTNVWRTKIPRQHSNYTTINSNNTTSQFHKDKTWQLATHEISLTMRYITVNYVYPNHHCSLKDWTNLRKWRSYEYFLVLLRKYIILRVNIDLLTFVCEIQCYLNCLWYTNK